MSKRKQKDPEALTSSKKARNDESMEYKLFAQASVNGLGSFAKMASELMEEICGYLEPQDILSMTKTSKAMNKQISLNPHIMKHIKLTIPPLDRLSEVDFGYRIYPNIVYRSHVIKDFKHVRESIQKIGLDVKTIIFPDKISNTALKQALSYMPNVRSVLIKRVTHFSSHRVRSLFSLIQLSREAIEKNHLQSEPTPIELPFLKSLTIHESGAELNIFSNSPKLENFAIHLDSYRHPVDAIRVQRFLNQQQSLQSLDIVKAQKVFKSYDIQVTEYKLKNLVVDHFGNNIHFEATKGNFEQFVNQHRDTLEKVSFQNGEFLHFFQDFPSLKEMILKTYPQRVPFSYPLMPFIEKLSLENLLHPKMPFPSFDSFPSLKEFRGRHFQSDTTLSHSEIERLDLDCCTFSRIEMPKLKSASIKFASVTFPVDFDALADVFDKVKDVMLFHCYGSDNWLKTLLEDPSTKLNKLEIAFMKLSRECVDAINQNRKKISSLILRNVTSAGATQTKK